MKIEKFNMELNKYIETGVFKIVLQNGHSIVCNVLNQYYVIFSTEVFKKGKGEIVGLLINSNGLLNASKYENYMYYYFNNLTPDERKKVMVELKDEYLKRLINAKPKYDLLPPGKNVDLQLEEELMARNKSK